MSLIKTFRRFWSKEEGIPGDAQAKLPRLGSQARRPVPSLAARRLSLEPLERRALLSVTTPDVSSVSTSTATGTYIQGTQIPITVTFNEAVTVTGTPQLALNAGSGATANYTSGSGTATLTFMYTVGAGQNTADLDYSSTSALGLNGGTIADGSGNAASLTLPATGSDDLATQDLTIAVQDGFATGDFSALPWQLSKVGTAANWTVQNTNVLPGSTFAAQSGAIGASSNSALSVTLTVGAGELSFFSSLSSATGKGSLVFEMDGTPVIQLSGTMAWQQSFVYVSAGQHTFTWLYGKNAGDPSGNDFVDLDFVQFVPGTTLTVTGTSATDQFNFNAAGSNIVVGLNGLTQSFAPGEFSAFLFAGKGGTATLTGSTSGSNQATLDSGGSGQLNNSTAGFTASATGMTDIDVNGSSGDTDQFDDSAGNSIYLAYADYNSTGAPLACMYGTGYANTATGFGTNIATSTDGAHDIAAFFTSPDTDSFYSYTNYQTSGQQLSGMYGSFDGGYSNSAKGFSTNVAYATDGSGDTAAFFDSAGNATYYAYADYNSGGQELAGMLATGYSNSASGFGTNAGASTDGSSDLAAFFDSPDSDTYSAYADYQGGGQTYGSMTGTYDSGYTNTATGFATIDAISGKGGSDTANLYNSNPTGNDTLYADAAIASLYGDDGSFAEQTLGFSTVNAYGSTGGSNVKDEGAISYQLNYIGTWTTGPSGAIPPSGYTVSADQSTINASDATAAGFTFADADVGDTYNYSITSSGGGTAVTGGGTVTSATQDITAINVSTLSDGTLTYSFTLTSSDNLTGMAATATATLDTTAPTGYSITPVPASLNATTDTSAGFDFSGATVGTTYDYGITSSGGGTAVTGSGSVTSATQDITGINLSTLGDGTLTYSVTLTDAAGNMGAPATASATLQTVVSGYAITANQSLINAADDTSAGFTFLNATAGDTYDYTVTSSGGGTAVTGSGSVTSATQDVTGINVSTLGDGTLTYSARLTDPQGNVGLSATASATLDTVAPSGYSITAVPAALNSTSDTDAGFDFTGAETGTTYNYSITSSGGGTAVTGSGSVTSASQDVTGINVSALGDGTLTYSVMLTDLAGNVGIAATASATLTTVIIPGYTITADQSVVNASEATDAGFTIIDATAGDTYDYTVASSGGSGSVTGSGAVTTATQDITGINVSTLSDGTLTYSVTLTNSEGNMGAAATASATLDTVAPSGYSITADQSTINTSHATAAGFTFTGAAAGDTYIYSITSSGGGTSVSASGTVTSATQDVTGIDVTALGDGTLTYSVRLTDLAGNTGTPATASATLDTTAPSGYTISPDQSLINASQANAVGVTFTGAETGDTYNFDITSPGGGSAVTASGTVTSATEDVTGINVSSLPDGTLAFSVTLTDVAGNVGGPATASATLDATAPSGYSITPDQSIINASQAAAAGFTFAGAEVGDTYSFSVDSATGGSPVTGSGSVTSATQDVTGINLSSLPDGTLTFNVTLTDAVGNVGSPAMASATLDTSTPSGYSITADQPIVNAVEAGATGFTFSGATTGTTYDYSIASSGGGTAVSGSGTVTSATEDVAGIDVASLSDGTLSFSVTLTDVLGNTGTPATASATLDATAPSGYTITADQSLISASQATALGFTFAGAETGDTYNFHITSSGGGSAVTGSGTVTSATQDVTGIDVSSLPDGTLGFSVTLTDVAGNVGSPATASATLETTAPSGYSVTPDQSIINASQAAAAGFTFAGAGVGDTYSFSVASATGGSPVTGSGSVTSATQDVTGINLSSLPDGTLTFSVTLTDAVGNVGSPATASATLDTGTPSGYSVLPDQSLINAAEAGATGFTFSGATTGTTYDYSITSAGGGTAVSGSGTVTSATEDVAGIDVASLADGTLTFSVTLTDVLGNTGTPATASATLETIAPYGYAIGADEPVINAVEASSTGFTFAGAEVATNDYTITSASGGTAVSGSGSVTSTSQDVAGIDVSALPDGTLTFSFTLTDPAGNMGAAATASATLDTTAPGGYSISADQSLINAVEASSIGFTFTGATTGTTYDYTITSSGGTGSVSGSGSVTATTQDVTGINVSTLSDGTLTYSFTLTDAAGNVGAAATSSATLDTAGPSGYSISADEPVINAAGAAAAGFTFTGAEVGTTYDYTITSASGGSAVTGSGSVTSAAQDVTGINVSSLPDGTLTFSFTLTDAIGNVGAQATASATLDTATPSGYTISADQSLINAIEASATGFTFTGATTGTTYDYTITSSGGAGAVSGSGSVTAAAQDVTGINVASLPDGTLTFSVTLTDVLDNVGAAATASATLDTVAPSGYSISTDYAVINANQSIAAGFTLAGAEVGTTYNFSVTSSNGGAPVIGSGSVTAATQDVTGINVASLPDGTLTFSVTLTNGAGNIGAAATASATLDTAVPTGYSISADEPVINATEALAAGFTFTGAEVGATYDYSVDSSGGPGSPVTGSGSVTAASQDITGINVSTLPDGMLIFTFELTNSVGNTGPAATATALLDTAAPTGYAISADEPLVNAGQAVSAGFTLSGAKVGATYDYTVTSSGGAGSVSGSSSVTAAIQDVTGVNVSTLADGTLSFSVTLTDQAGYVGAAATASATLDTVAPSGYSITSDQPVINASQAAAVGFTFAGAEVGDTFDFTIASVTSPGGGGTVTGSGSVTSATEDVSGINISSIPDGTLTFSVTLTNAVGNTGAAATASATLDTAAPSGYAITADQPVIDAAQAASTGFTFTAAELGTVYDFTITSSAGGTAVTGSGSVTSATQDITGIDVSALSDGTLTFSVTLTDPAGNTGAAATASATLDA